MDHWIEAADWIVWQLCGTYVRNACTAGFKAARQDGAYPSPDYFAALHPDFERFALEKLDRPIGAARRARPAGSRTRCGGPHRACPPGSPCAWATSTPTSPRRPRGRSGPGQLVAIMGTSTCHVMIGDRRARRSTGMCGVVDGGIVPGLWGYEAGQSGVGDIFGWFVDHAVPAEVQRRGGRGAADRCTSTSAHWPLAQPVGAHGLVALDWHSGNRSVLVDHDLSGLVVGLTLQTRPEDVYRALIEATAFGTRVIVESFDAAGVPVRRLHRRAAAC